MQEMLTSQMCSYERGRAERLHGKARSLEVQLVRDCCGQRILVVSNPYLETIHRLQYIGDCSQFKQIGTDIRTTEHTNQASIRRGIVASKLQGLPGTLQKEAMLRISQFSFTWTIAKEVCIEQIDVLHNWPSSDIV